MGPYDVAVGILLGPQVENLRAGPWPVAEAFVEPAGLGIVGTDGQTDTRPGPVARDRLGRANDRRTDALVLDIGVQRVDLRRIIRRTDLGVLRTAKQHGVTDDLAVAMRQQEQAVTPLLGFPAGAEVMLGCREVGDGRDQS